MSNLGRPTSRVHPTPPGKPCICRVGDNHSAARLHLCPPPFHRYRLQDHHHPAGRAAGEAAALVSQGPALPLAGRPSELGLWEGLLHILAWPEGVGNPVVWALPLVQRGEPTTQTGLSQHLMSRLCLVWAVCLGKCLHGPGQTLGSSWVPTWDVPPAVQRAGPSTGGQVSCADVPAGRRALPFHSSPTGPSAKVDMRLQGCASCPQVSSSFHMWARPQLLRFCSGSSALEMLLQPLASPEPRPCSPECRVGAGHSQGAGRKQQACPRVCCHT